MRETRGTLVLEADALVFRPEDGAERRIAFPDIRRARRLVGSPVLMVVHAEDGVAARTAFYFVQPPPLEPAGRTSRRRNRRQSMSYLGSSNRELKETLKDWERAVGEAARRAGA